MERSVRNDGKPYIFVSYAHKDSDKVLPLIRELQNRGVRIWYDEGIEAGTEWPAYIEERLENCNGVIVFLSDNSIESVNCRNEVNVAAELQKEMLVAQLDDDVEYKYGMRLQLSSRQKIFCNRHKGVASAIDEMIKHKMFGACLGDAPITGIHTDTRVSEKKTAVSENAGASAKSKAMLIVAGVLALIAVIALLLVVLLPKGEGSSDAPGESTVGESNDVFPPETEIIEMSDDLFDFIFELEGVLYKLPCAYSAFTDNGWTISTSGFSDDTMIAALSYELYYMSKNGRNIQVCSYNMSGNSVKLSDCKIGGVSVALDGGAALSLAKGITPASSVEEIKNAYGTPNDYNSSSTYEKLVYSLNGSEYNCYEFICYANGDDSYVRISNLVEGPEDNTVTNTETPAYLSDYKAPATLGEDIYASVLMIEGDLYKLPAPVSSFIDNGWEIASKPSYVVSRGSDYVTLKKNGKELDFYIVNFAEYQTTVENCAVYKVEVLAQDGIDIALPGIGKPITVDLTASEIAPLLPDKFTFDEVSSYNFYNYYEHQEREYSVSVMIEKATGIVYKISISCETWIH